MARDAYLKYDQQAIYNFTSKALDSYKVLTRYLESTVNSDKYFKLLFTEKKEFHNFLYGDVSSENDTVNNVMGNAVSVLYLIADSKEDDIKDDRVTNYLYYAIWNINNTLISTFESLLISLLEDIFIACKLSSNMGTIIYYSLCIVAVFVFMLCLILITYCVWKKKNAVARLLLDVNIKAYTKIKDVCEEIRMNLQNDHDFEEEDGKQMAINYEDTLFQGHHSRRTFQAVGTYIRGIVFLYVVSFAILESFIGASFYMEYSNMVALSKFSGLFKDTTLIGVTFFDLINSFKNRIINDSHIQMYKGMDAVKYSDESIISSLDLSINSYMAKQVDRTLFSDDVYNNITFIMNNDLCNNNSLYLYFESQDECEMFEDGIAKSGIQLLFAKLTLELRNVYRNIIIETEKKLNDPKYDMTIILMNDPTLLKISIVIRKLFSQSQMMLINNFINGVQQKSQSIKSIKLYLFIGLYLFLGLFMAYSLVYGILKAKNDMLNSVQMISLLPIKAITSTNSIKQYISSKVS